MDEYISRKAAKDAIFDYICGHTMSKFPSAELLVASKRGAEGALNELDYVPTADVVEVKHGEWIKVNENYPRYACTSCQHLYNNRGYKYCPCCGAKMDGGKNEQI